MVCVYFDDPEELARCADFLRFAFPGQIRRSAHELELEFMRGDFRPAVEQLIVERLLWAWRTEDGSDTGDGVIVESVRHA